MEGKKGVEEWKMKMIKIFDDNLPENRVESVLNEFFELESRYFNDLKLIQNVLLTIKLN